MCKILGDAALFALIFLKDFSVASYPFFKFVLQTNTMVFQLHSLRVPCRKGNSKCRLLEWSQLKKKKASLLIGIKYGFIILVGAVLLKLNTPIKDCIIINNFYLVGVDQFLTCAVDCNELIFICQSFSF